MNKLCLLFHIFFNVFNFAHAFNVFTLFFRMVNNLLAFSKTIHIDAAVGQPTMGHINIYNSNTIQQ